MALPGVANLMVERLRGVESQDSHGNTVTDWTTPSVLAIDGCWIGPPGRGVEYRQDRQTVVTDQIWWGPPDADVVPKDRIRDPESGIVYEVAGPVLTQHGFHNLLNHKEAPLQVIDE